MSGRNVISNLIIAIFLIASPAFAAKTCDNRTFQGSYAYYVDGNVWNVPEYGPISGPVVRVGLFKADGNGAFQTDSLASYAGIPAANFSPQGWVAETSYGTYSIKPDCSVTIHVGAPPPLNLIVTFSGSITSDGGHLSWLQVNPKGTTVKGAMTQLRRTPCLAQDLEGVWGVEMRGTILPPIEFPVGPPLGTLHIGLPKIAGDYSMVGQVKFTNDLPTLRQTIPTGGTVEGNTTVSYQGVLNNESWKGTFTANHDCTFSVRYGTKTPNGDLSLSWWGVFTQEDNSRTLHFIMSELLYGPLVGDAWPQ